MPSPRELDAPPAVPTAEQATGQTIRPPADLSRVAARGAGVTLAGQGVRIALQLVSVIVLARLLSPRDYGLLAVGLVVVGVGEVVRDLGLSQASIRAPSLTTHQRSGLFWVNSAAGLCLTLTAVAGSGLVATVFAQPALTPVIRAMALTFLLNGMAAQFRAGLSRDLRFAALVGTDLAAQACAQTVAITAAICGAGYWALVAQQLTQGAIGLVTVVVLSRWLPGRPRRNVGLRPFLRVGGGLTGTSLLYFLGNNLDNIALGLTAGPVALGIYSRGFQLLMNPLNQVRSPASTAAVPVLARIQADVARSAEWLRRGQLALGFSLVPALALVAGAAEPIVALFLGPRWLPVAPVLALLAVAGSAQTLALVGSWVYLSRGLSGALLRYTAVTVLLNGACIGAGSRYGVVGVAAGYATASLLEWPLSLWWLGRITPIPVRALLLGALRITACAVLAGVACAAAVGGLPSAPAVLRIAAGAGSVLAVYGALAGAVPQLRSDMTGVLVWGRQVVGRG